MQPVRLEQLVQQVEYQRCLDRQDLRAQQVRHCRFKEQLQQLENYHQQEILAMVTLLATEIFMFGCPRLTRGSTPETFLDQLVLREVLDLRALIHKSRDQQGRKVTSVRQAQQDQVLQVRQAQQAQRSSR